MQDYFYTLSDHIISKLTSNEALLISFSGEQSEFVRFNKGLVRQAGSVTQSYFTMDLICGKKHAAATISLCHEKAVDVSSLEEKLTQLRSQLGSTPEDPYLLYNTEPASTERIEPDRLPEKGGVLETILSAAAGKEMVGIYVQGTIYAGFYNSLGQKNWYATPNFHFEWSLYHEKDKAVKSSYAGFQWSTEEFHQKFTTASEQLELLKKPPKTIKPGRYRVYLAPAALDELTGMLTNGGFSLKAHKTKTTSLLKMVEENETLSPKITMAENTEGGIAPNFQEQGYLKPDGVELISGGQFRNCLVSPRSGKEYGAEPNGASATERPESLDIAPGDLAGKDILSKLDTGLYVNQLWYLNYSDRPACRITGMTRFATFWVENGKIHSPLQVMRFDETIFRALGSCLEGLTAERDFLPSSRTYGSRSTSSTHLPGALIDAFTFTL